jgi:FPC/CPF motif-containing protein YcgG
MAGSLLAIPEITREKGMTPTVMKLSGMPEELTGHPLYLLDQDLEKRVEGLPGYFREALAPFRENVGDKAYPCYFGRRALQQGELFVTHVGKDAAGELAGTLAAFLDYVRATPQRRQVLAAFAEPAGEQSHEDHARRFWGILRWLHDNDPRAWPADVPGDPHDPAWEFSFNGTPMFVFAAAPTHELRRSRNLGDCLVLLFQPRNVFTGIEGGTRAGKVARRRIRDALDKWDIVPVHPSMGDYGDPSNFEWRQYFVPDGQSDMYPVCPLSVPSQRGRE